MDSRPLWNTILYRVYRNKVKFEGSRRIITKTRSTEGGFSYSLNNVYELESNVIFEVTNQMTPIVGVSTPIADSDAMKIVYDLNGREVARGEKATDGLTPSIYMVRQGNTTTKTLISQ